MARIKLGSFGNVTPGRVQQVAAPDLSAETRAVGNLGGTVVDIGLDLKAQETRQQQEELARQSAQADAADRAKESAALLDAEDKLRDIHDEIGNQVATGQIGRDEAEGAFNEQAKKTIDGAMPGFREENRPLVAPRLGRAVNTLGNSMRRIVEKRAKQEVTTAISSGLETFERLYQTDPKGAESGASALIAQMGPWSDLSPEQLGRIGQNWREKTQYTAGFQAVSSAREDRKALAEAEKFVGTLPDLDPQKRAQLIDRAQAYRMTLDQKAEMAAARAERERDRVLRRAEHEFNAFQALADKGTALDPAYLDRALQNTAGTPYAPAIKALAMQARETGGLAAQPLSVQRATLDQINTQIAQQGRSPELDKRKDQVEKVLRGSMTDLGQDALRAGLERGVITELLPLDMSGGFQGLAPQMVERVQAAQRVQQWAERPVSPFTDEEAATVKRQLDSLPVKERSAVVAGLASSLGPQQAAAMAEQMSPKDRGLALALAAAGGTTTAGRFTSELILRGQQAKLDGTSTKGLKEPEVKASTWRAHAATELEGVFGDPRFTTQVRDAAELIMHGIAAEKGGGLTRRDMDRAIGMAIGGTIVEHAGRRIPLPAGIDQDMLEKRLESVTPEELSKQAPDGMVRAGGVPMPLAELVQSLPGQQLMPVRPGEFAVIVQGRPVVNTQGEPVIVKVR